MPTENQSCEDKNAEREYTSRIEALATNIEEIKVITQNIVNLCGIRPQNTNGQ